MSWLRSGVDLYMLYSIVSRLARPFTEWEAYKVGLIDEKGNFLVKKPDRTQEQRNALTYMDLFILNLKKIIQKVPFANSRLVTYAAALFLLREEKNVKSERCADILAEQFLKEDLKMLIEEALPGTPTNNMSSGAIANSDNKNLLLGNKILKRRKPKKT